MQNLALLQQLGLEEKESRIYLAILELGSSTVKPIADRAEIKRTSVYNIIDHLIEIGLITQAVIRGRTHYQAISPTRLADIQRERLRLVEEEMPLLIGLFNSTSNKPRIHYYEGAAQMRQALFEETRCKHQTSFLLPATDLLEMLGVETVDEVNRLRVSKGVLARSLRIRSKAMDFPTSAQSTRNLLTVRYAPEKVAFSMAVGLYDTGKVGFFSSRNEGFAIMIESQELYLVMSTFFEMLWEMSESVKAGEG